MSTVAVFGNPNAGKTTVFNCLTGLSQKVANYPGVTVEKKEGFVKTDSGTIRLLDLPGTYSLAAFSPDEMVAVDVLLGRQAGVPLPDLILHVIDASNLERNLYLYSQLAETGIPVIIALNMTDVAQKRGREVDPEKLSNALRCPVIPIQAHKGVGIDGLVQSLKKFTQENASDTLRPGICQLPQGVEEGVGNLREEFAHTYKAQQKHELERFELLRALIDQGGQTSQRLNSILGDSFTSKLRELRASLEQDEPLAAQEAAVRYHWIHQQVELAKIPQTETTKKKTSSEFIDNILTHNFFGILIFLLIMLVVFQSIFAWAGPLMDLIDSGTGAVQELVASWLPEGQLQSLIVDGVIAGVGGVVIFLPQILILFLLLGLLEDCGYMARAAYLMDNIMRKCGLSGKSFIPMLSGFACAIPGVMAARVVENRRDRLATILVTPLMSCSARLPVYILLTQTFIPNHEYLGGWLNLQGIVYFCMYILGIVVAIAMAFLLKKTLLKGPRPTFVLELPGYKWPAIRTVGFRLLDRGKAFLVRAGTLILAISIVVWGLSYYPRSDSIAQQFEQQRVRAQNAGLLEDVLEERLEEISLEEKGAQLDQSYFGRMGKTVEPVFMPLGWDWKISMSAIASFPAREVIVATLGIIYNLGDEVDEENEALREKLKSATWEESKEPVYNIPVALSIMVFFALCCQCGATLATIKRETNSWFWTVFTFVYMTGLAYVAAFITYQVGMMI